MRKLLTALAAFGVFVGMACATAPREMVIVVGTGGEPTYQTSFDKDAATWAQAASGAGLKVQTIAGKNDALSKFQSALSALPKDGGDLWLVLIGHGTFDGKNAKFNLPGDDLSASDLAQWLKPFQRRVIVLNLFSASGAFLPALSGRNRVILTATRSGSERNYSRFGEKLAQSLDNLEADLDGDGRVSLSETAVFATSEVAKFYDGEQRVLPEHALLDDNGDRLGTEISTLVGPHAVFAGKENPDGLVAAEVSLRESAQTLVLTPTQEEQRAGIERKIAALRAKKGELNEDNYYRELETLLLEMAALYDEVRGSSQPPQNSP